MFFHGLPSVTGIPGVHLPVLIICARAHRSGLVFNFKDYLQIQSRCVVLGVRTLTRDFGVVGGHTLAHDDSPSHTCIENLRVIMISAGEPEGSSGVRMVCEPGSRVLWMSPESEVGSTPVLSPSLRSAAWLVLFTGRMFSLHKTSHGKRTIST